MHTYIHTYMHACMHTYGRTDRQTVRTYVKTYVCTYVYTHVHMYIRTYVLTYIHAYRHTDIHFAYIYIYTYTPQTCVSFCGEAQRRFLHTGTPLYRGSKCCCRVHVLLELKANNIALFEQFCEPFLGAHTGQNTLHFKTLKF